MVQSVHVQHATADERVVDAVDKRRGRRRVRGLLRMGLWLLQLWRVAEREAMGKRLRER
jgi:hypothetical protein